MYTKTLLLAEICSHKHYYKLEQKVRQKIIF